MSYFIKYLSLSLIMLATGCATLSSVPDGYDLDTTPDDNGEHYR